MKENLYSTDPPLELQRQQLPRMTTSETPQDVYPPKADTIAIMIDSEFRANVQIYENHRGEGNVSCISKARIFKGAIRISLHSIRVITWNGGASLIHKIPYLHYPDQLPRSERSLPSFSKSRTQCNEIRSPSRNERWWKKKSYLESLAAYLQ